MQQVLDEGVAKPARGRIFTPKELGQISGLRAGGMLVEDIAAFMRCSLGMLQRKAKKELADGASHVNGIVTLNIVQKAMRGEKPYDIFYAKTRLHWRETHNIQPLDADGNPSTGLGFLGDGALAALVAAGAQEESSGGGARGTKAARPKEDSGNGAKTRDLESPSGSADDGD